ncbi:FlgO family outer membrane protein [Nitrincola sp. MINF-07-Sa-05]|uniref:FlgO family outer membrane protein n=1 Tax=Nitrincola salilacus TaxID=3400273 RepID=UPI0039180D05
MSYRSLLLLLILSVLLLSGCRIVTSDDPMPVHIQSVDSSVASRGSALPDPSLASARSADLALVEHSGSGTDPVSEAIQQMAAQLASGLDENRVKRLPLAILPFSRLESRGEAGSVGERLAESFIFQMEYLGYNLVDYRAVSLTTTSKPDLSDANLSMLRNRNRIYFILTGTYAEYSDGVVVNARVLDTTTRQVIAAAQSHIPYQRFEETWPGYKPLQARERGMIIENRRGPVGIE